ncbi:sialic acid-binding Ig-like lectin 8 [Aquarana catesbeiana]|uniref:sialic acid-binding Ig-like lectin 8 n=1 Tax=Aquarana catesbeiana TaxID=8400 RepID=UPI003CC9DBC6
MRLDKGCNILECLVIIILFELSKDIECQRHYGYTLQVTRRVTVQEHCCVTIPCAFTASNKNVFTNSKGHWKNINTNDIVAATYTSINNGTKSNFNITGDTDKGDCTLTITDVKKQDSGTYYFRFEGPVLYDYKVKTITVIVTDPPKKPEVAITSDEDPPKKPEVAITSDEVPRSLSYSVFAWIVSGNVIFLLLVALGLYCFIKRQKEKKPTRSGSHVYELDDQNKAEYVYQDLSGRKNSNSIYHTIKQP